MFVVVARWWLKSRLVSVTSDEDTFGDIYQRQRVSQIGLEQVFSKGYKYFCEQTDVYSMIIIIFLSKSVGQQVF